MQASVNNRARSSMRGSLRTALASRLSRTPLGAQSRHTSSTTSAMPKPSFAPSWRRAKAAAASSALSNSSISTRHRKKHGSSPTSNSETMSSSERWRFYTESHRGRRISEKAPIVSLSKKGTAQTSPLPPRDAGASLLLHLNANISPTKRAISRFLTLRVI